MHHRTGRLSNLPKHLWLGYVFLVVYGSLVPLDFHSLPLDTAWHGFQHIPFLKLGVESRADWVANGVLYFPVGFLTAYLLIQSPSRLWRIGGMVCALAFSTLLAIGVEFAQQFFPPRTVSLNDLLAEVAGSMLGIAAASGYANWFLAFLKSFTAGSQKLTVRLYEAYACAYFAMAFFPYDFLLSSAEMLGKIHSANWGWVMAGSSSRPLLVGLQFVLELGLAVPLGVLMIRLAAGRIRSYWHAALAGFALGCFIEGGQLLIASGVSQGLSVLSRILGVCLGFALHQRRDLWALAQFADWLKRYILVLGGLYVLALAGINNWFVLPWQGAEAAALQLASVNFLPFYYHYYSTEAKALFSFVVVCLSYMPIGVLAWAGGRSAHVATAVALVVAAGMEGSKLFLKGAHPDPTNIWLAGVTTWAIMGLLQRLRFGDLTPAHNAMLPPLSQPPPSARFPLWPAAPLLGVAAWLLWFPAFPVFLLLLIVGCAAAVWWRPVLLFAIVPAFLPVLDLAPWSGRFYLDEFDALMAVGLMIAFARRPSAATGSRRADMVFLLLATGFALSIAISSVRGLLPFQWPDANAFITYYSPYNALRIAKGAVWAGLLCLLAGRLSTAGMDVRRPFYGGLGLGLAMTVAVILWERVAFSGLWNFTEGYRVTGPFSAMHTGGAYIECFLAVSAPMLIFWMLEWRSWLARLIGFALLLATTYALMVTFSRNGYTAYAAGVVVMALAAMLRARQRLKGFVTAIGLLAALLMVALPVFKGEFAQARMATVKADLDIRAAHWRDALDIRDSGWDTVFFGMGLGRYPATNFFRGEQLSRPGTYQLAIESGNTYLRIGSGNSIYVEQFVAVKPGHTYTLKLDVRPSVANAVIAVPICEKWMLTSYNCIWQSMEAGKEPGAWRRLEMRVTGKDLLAGHWYSRRPVKLALYYTTPKSTIDVDNVRLIDGDCIDLVSNGDFSNGFDHWFYSADSHLQWHIKSLFYGVLFDHGWLGLASLGGLLLLALARSARNALRGDVGASAALAATISFLVVGVFDTLVDSPRFLLLLLLLIWFCAQRAQPAGLENQKCL